ncbi:MAG: thiamine pyrophosphate-dependent enzyme, partial [Candidatus Bathyarchaeia archaeon]
DGPTFIEAVTYRIGPHSTSDDPRKYRSDEEVEAWRLKDPVKRFRLYLEAKSLWSESQEKQLQEKITAELNAAVKEAEEALEPPAEWLFTDVYATLPANLVEQLAECEFIQRGKRDKGRSEVESG